jgi:hypothetical protein
MQDEWMKGTIFIGTKKVIPTKQRERIRRTRPGIHEKQNKMLEIARTDAIVHPRTVVVHAAYTAIANTTVMRAGWFKGLALSTHGM